MTNKTFSQWLLTQLESRGLSQVELSRKSGISQAQITRVLSGERGIGEKALIAIAAALKLPPEQVFREAGLLPKKEVDEEAEELLHKILLLTPSSRATANVIIDALAKEDSDPNSITKRLSAKVAKG